MTRALPCSRRDAIGALLRAVAMLPGFGTVPRPPLFAIRSASSRLGTSAIVALHLEHLERCGAACADHAGRIRPALLAAARARDHASGRRAAESAFALLDHFGEFPPVQGPLGGWQ